MLPRHARPGKETIIRRAGEWLIAGQIWTGMSGFEQVSENAFAFLGGIQLWRGRIGDGRWRAEQASTIASTRQAESLRHVRAAYKGWVRRPAFAFPVARLTCLISFFSFVLLSGLRRLPASALVDCLPPLALNLPLYSLADPSPAFGALNRPYGGPSCSHRVDHSLLPDESPQGRGLQTFLQA